MRGLIAFLSHRTLLRRACRGLRIHRLANAWLRRHPLVRRMPGSGIVYRATRLESIPLAVDLLARGGLYDASLLPEDFRTFADLGCNVGYFTCWLAHLSRGRRLRGLMLDANPDAVEEARWHARANGLDDVFGVHGILGEAGESGTADFFLYESNICSTSRPAAIEGMGFRGGWTKIAVPLVRMEDEWIRRFGGERCHLLKIDIEGSEAAFLRAESAFLARVDAVLIEWHRWGARPEDVRRRLEDEGFDFVKTLGESEHMGTFFFRRVRAARPPDGVDVGPAG